MDWRLLFFSTVLNIIFISPGGIQTQVTAVSSRQHQQQLPLVSLTCPSPNELTVCNCEGDWIIDCNLPNKVSYEQFKRDLRTIKEKSLNNGENGLIKTAWLVLSGAELENFDLILLQGFSVRWFGISNLSALKKISGGLEAAEVFSNIERVLITGHPQLDDQGLADTLWAFSKSPELLTLDLSSTSLKGGNGDEPEFLPGLSSLTALEELWLPNNQITHIFSRHFQMLVKLKDLDLSNNKIVTVHYQGSLCFVPNNLNTLIIDFQYNVIEEIIFSKVNSSSMATTGNSPRNSNAVSFQFARNNLSSFPFEIFDDFLQGNSNNTIHLSENPMICDRRHEEIRQSDNPRFLNQIKGATCSNLQEAPFFKKAEDKEKEFVCPDPNKIQPCTCRHGVWGLRCSGDRINQETIDNAFQVLKIVNKNPEIDPENQWLTMHSFYLESTHMTELDLSPLFHTSISALVIGDNKNLTKLTASQIIPPATIDASLLNISGNSHLDDEGLGDTLKLFLPTMSILELSENSLRGHLKGDGNYETNSAGQVKNIEREFLPGLAGLFNLGHLVLADNKIENLGVGRFRNNSKLKRLSLRENKISKLQKNVFLFYKTFNDFDETVTIDLQENFLSADSFPLHVFGSTPIVLNLENNKNLSAQYLFPRDDSNPIWSEQTWTKISMGLIYGNSSSSSPLICPEPSEIYPCFCNQNYGEVVCYGPKVSQKSVEILFQKLKEINRNKNESKLVIDKVKIFNTSMIEFDLSPLIDCQISTLLVFGNPLLSQITKKISTGSTLIAVKELIIDYNPNLTDLGIENLLIYFEPTIEILSLAENSLTLNKPLNGLADLENLKRLNLRSNKISQLSSNLFDGVINRHLELLDLSENQIERIHQGAFGFSPDNDFQIISNSLEINLNFNPLTENSFPWNKTGLEKIQRPIQLNLVHNKMTTLPFGPFNFLLTQKPGQFQIDLYGNPLVCDWRLNWLEKSPVLISTSIKNLNCEVQQELGLIFQKSDNRDFCSEIKNVLPCSCPLSSNSIECVGDQINNDGFQELFVNLKRLGPFCWGYFKKLDKIVIRSTKLTRLDLTDFFESCLTNLTSLIVDANLNLTRIIGPPILSNPVGELIKVENLEISSNSLTDDGLGSTLKYFHSQMTTLKLNGNELNGSVKTEFLPGLSNLKYLGRIELKSNKITQLAGSPFKNNIKLRRILLSENKISAIGPGAFLFDKDHHDNETLEIDLTSNLLVTESFDKDSRLEEIDRKVNLKLSRNYLSTIPAVPFESFFSRPYNSTVDLEGNPLVCDESMLWLKERKLEFWDQVKQAECGGGPIFGSEFFDSQDTSEKPTKKNDWIYITVSALLVVMFSILIGIGVRKNRHLQIRLRNLTPTEIREFFDGDPKAAKLENPRVEDLSFSKKIDPKHLVIQRHLELGRGEFGVVCLGVFKGQHVAVKTVPKKADTTFFKEFLRELKMMQHLGRHPHVVSFLGAQVSKIGDRIVYAVMELGVENLEDHFKRNPIACVVKPEIRETLKSKFVGWAIQIASGMEFLESKRVIHADLAARNVLMFPSNVLKITDFGLARKLYKQKSAYNRNPDCLLPFAWLAIESLTRLEFTHKSDVWTFAVLLWEIFSYGKVPFAFFDRDPANFKRLMERREIFLEMPTFADMPIYEMMRRCWDHEPSQRPSFEYLRKFFSEYFTNLETSGEISKLETPVERFEAETISLPVEDDQVDVYDKDKSKPAPAVGNYVSLATWPN